MLDFILDPKFLVALLLGVISFAVAWGAINSRISGIVDNQKSLKNDQVVMRVDINSNTVAIAQLKTAHEYHGERLDAIVIDLKEVVRDLQHVAQDLARRGGGTSQ